jgi:4-aminobutyrate aminotransferase
MAIKIKVVPGPKAKRVADFYKRYNANTSFEYPLVIKDGSGAYVQDVDNNWFLDFSSQVASLALGYKHPEIMKVLKKYSAIGGHKLAGQDFYNEEAAELTKTLLTIVPKKLRRVFLANTGAEAVENAMKLIWRKTGPIAGLSFTGAFHGRTIGALSYTHSKAVQKKNYPEVPHHILKFCTSDADPEINELEKFIALGGKPSFVIIEPIQGEGGYNTASRKFLQIIRKVTKLNNIPLVVDEIQSGVGRTGKWWAFENYKIEPDFITSAKHLQVGAVVFPNEYNPIEQSTISTTWGGGHRIDMAVGAATIKTIRKQKLLDNAKKIGEHIHKRLKEMQKARPKFIVDVRGIGLMRALELPSSDIRNKVIQQSFKQGLCLLPCAERAIRIAPPLIIKQQEADEGLNILEKVIKTI